MGRRFLLYDFISGNDYGLRVILSPEMKFHFCQNDGKEVILTTNFGLYHINSYNKLTRHRKEKISFHSK